MSPSVAPEAAVVGTMMDATEFHAMFHEAATCGWDEDELRQWARMWAETSGTTPEHAARGA